MNVTFASNQVLTAKANTTVNIYTDPVPLNGDDRLTTITLAHYIYGGTSPVAKLTYKSRVSNDGVYWVDQGIDDTTGVTAADTPKQASATVNAAFVRLKITFNPGDADGAVCFDIHAVIDKA